MRREGVLSGVWEPVIFEACGDTKLSSNGFSTEVDGGPRGMSEDGREGGGGRGCEWGV